MKIRFNGVVERHSRIGYSGCSACGGGNHTQIAIDTKKPYTVIECGMRFEFLFGMTYNIPDEIAEKLLEKYQFVDGYKHYSFEKVE